MSSHPYAAPSESSPAVAESKLIDSWYYYGWVIVLVGSLGMAATLPARTHGLGLIQPSLIADLKLSGGEFAWWNFYATLLGAIACLPCGWLIDKLGSRIVLTAVTAGLGATVLAMTRTNDPNMMFWLLVSTRAFGQGMLSIASLTIIEKWFLRRISLAMGLFAILMTVGMVALIVLAQDKLGKGDWRTAWESLGYVVLAVSAISLVFGASEPRNRSRLREFAKVHSAATATEPPPPSATWQQALANPAFWVVSLAVSFFGLASAGVSLFQQDIIKERGFDLGLYFETLKLGLFVGLGTNLVAGALGMRVPLGKLLAVGMLILGSSYLVFPYLEEPTHLYLYTFAQGIGGGIATFVFFAAWAYAYGPQEVGRIQGAAQLLTVLASAFGPMLVSGSREATGSFTQIFQIFSVVSFMFAAVAWLIPVPSARAGYWAKKGPESA